MLRLDIGCGNNVKEGFVGVDLRPLASATHCCNAWEVNDHIEENSVDEIYSKDLLNYLTFMQASSTLRAWFQVLKPGGVMQIILPDYAYWSRAFTDNKFEDPSPYHKGENMLQSLVWSLWGKQRGDLDETWDVIKSGYDFKLLSGMLLKAGFKTIFRVNENKPHILNILAQKRGDREEEQARLELEEFNQLKGQGATPGTK